MNDRLFRTREGVSVPAVTAEQMREVDRIAMEEFGLTILQMMENAGRNLAENVMDMLGGVGGQVTVLAGSGGNGFQVWVVLSKEAATLTGAARNQLQILQAAGVQPVDVSQAQAKDVMRRAQLVVDALIGYSLRGPPRGRVVELIELCNQHAAQVLSLDVPSGLDATTGRAPGPVVRPERTLTLALPKTGLQRVPGELYLADIGIPPEVFGRLGLSFELPFGEWYWIRLERGPHTPESR